MHRGKIGHCYGVSTNPCGCWWSVSGRRNGYEAPSFPRMLQDAAAVGGGKEGHSLRVLQVPLNILELGTSPSPLVAVVSCVVPTVLLACGTPSCNHMVRTVDFHYQLKFTVHGNRRGDGPLRSSSAQGEDGGGGLASLCAARSS